MKKNENGFSAIEILIVITVISVMGIMGWYVFSKRNESAQQEKKTNTAETTKQDTPVQEAQNTDKPDAPATDALGYEVANYKTYTNSNYGITFKYPDKWSVKEDLQSTTDIISLSMDDESVPGAGAPTVFAISITKQKLTAENRKDVYSNNAKDAGYTTALESGKFFNFNGYKFTHTYKENTDPEFYYYVLDTPNEPTEIQVNMQRFDYDKDQKTIQLALSILNNGKLGK